MSDSVEVEFEIKTRWVGTFDDLDSMIAGSGCTQWPWYHASLVPIGDGSGWTVAMTDPGNDDEVIRTHLLVDHLIRALNEVPGWVRDDFLSDNLDAVGADVIVQQAVYGEVVFG